MTQKKKTRRRRAADPETEAMLKGVASAIEETLNKGINARWNRVEDRLPENGQMVVALLGDCLGDPNLAFDECFTIATFVERLDYDDGSEAREKVFCGYAFDYSDGEVTHWAPLPELPKELLTKSNNDKNGTMD